MLTESLSYFFIYAFLGWSVEVAYSAMTRGKYVNAGLLNGPWCPIYGFGMLGIILLLEPVRNNLLLLFLGAVMITSLLELVTGIILEKVFHQKWWDYSDRPFNLGGYICLLFSVVWGLGAVLLVEQIHPLVSRLVSITPQTLSLFLLVILIMLLVTDAVVTVNTIFKLNRKLENMEELSLRIRETSEDIGEALSSSVFFLAGVTEELGDQLEETRSEIRERFEEERDEFRQRLDEGRMVDYGQEMQDGPAAADRSDARDPERGALLEEPVFGERRLIRAFPRVISSRHDASMQKLRDYYTSGEPLVNRFEKASKLLQGKSDTAPDEWPVADRQKESRKNRKERQKKNRKKNRDNS